MTRFWLAFTTPPQKEREAQKHLREQGITAFVPIVSRVVSSSGKKKLKTFPAAPGYVFVEFPMWQKYRYHVAKETKFVRGVVLVDGKPGRIPHDRMLDFVHSIAQLKPNAPQFELRKGAKVSVKKGKFAELDVMVLFVGQTKSKIQVHIFGSPREVIVDNSQLQPVVASTKPAASGRKLLQEPANQFRQNLGRWRSDSTGPA